MFIRKYNECPFYDETCPDDVHERFPKIDGKSCCEYCVKTHFNDKGGDVDEV